MASGRPDYFRGVDITYQTLAQITNRPKYGGALSAGGAEVMPANEELSLALITGKGMIYGGYIWVDYSASQAEGLVSLYVEGTLILAIDLLDLKKFCIDRAWAGPFYIMNYDDVDFIYSLGVSYGLTFESSFEFRYTERDGGTPIVYFDIVYALI